MNRIMNLNLNTFKQMGQCFKTSMVIKSTNNDKKLKKILLPDKMEIIEYNKPLILFDLNGTLTNNWEDRNEQNRGLLFRPEIKNLRRLKGKFDLGIYSCMRDYNVNNTVRRLEQTLGYGIFKFVLNQNHCDKAYVEMCEKLNKPYAMTKPIGKHSIHLNKTLSKIVIVDDTYEKILKEEKENLILVPTWNKRRDDNILEILVTYLLRYIPSNGDVRKKTNIVNNRLMNLIN